MQHDHRKLGMLLNQRVRQLLEQPQRSAEQAQEMRQWGKAARIEP